MLLRGIQICWKIVKGVQRRKRLKSNGKAFFYSKLQYESLEGLIDFLAFLVQKLGQNKQKVSRGIPTNSLRNPHKIWGLLAITLAPETFKASKDSFYNVGSKQTFSHNFCSLSGWWCHKRKTKRKQNISQPWRHPPKTQILISKVFFSVQTARLQEFFGGLNSSLT